MGVDHRVAKLGEHRRQRARERDRLEVRGDDGRHVQDRRRVEEELAEHRPDVIDVAVADVERREQHRHSRYQERQEHYQR